MHAWNAPNTRNIVPGKHICSLFSMQPRTHSYAGCKGAGVLFSFSSLMHRQMCGLFEFIMIKNGVNVCTLLAVPMCWWKRCQILLHLGKYHKFAAFDSVFLSKIVWNWWRELRENLLVGTKLCLQFAHECVRLTQRCSHIMMFIQGISFRYDSE